jgi:competence protein ComEC
LYSVLLNLLILPLCPLLLCCGLAGTVAGLFNALIGRIVLFPCHLILVLYRLLMQATDLLPGGILITGQPPLGYIILFYAVLFTGGWFYQHRREGGGSIAAVLASAFLVLAVPAESRLELTMLDVGQGDGLYISSADGTRIMIDGGSSSVKNVGKNRILPFLKYRKVRGIDLWLVSHTDEDHINGLIEAMDAGFPIRTLVLSRVTPSDAQLASLKKSASANHTAIRYIQTGSRIRTADFTMRCLAPDADPKGLTDDKNELSQVWELKSRDLSVLFTGDAGEVAEKHLLAEGTLSDIMVLKAGHHGSRYSSSGELLGSIGADTALISVGYNTYGHPTYETLERLSAYGYRIYRTDINGTVEIFLGN